MKLTITLSAITVLAALALAGCAQNNPSDSTDTQSTNSSMNDGNGTISENTNMPATNSLSYVDTNMPASNNQ